MPGRTVWRMRRYIDPVGRSRRSDAAAAPAGDPDARALDELIAAGADLDAERPIRHYVVCAHRAGASTAVLQLREAGFEAAMSENPTAAGWIVVAERTEVVDIDSIRLGRSLLELIAERCDATYDGWHTELVDGEGAGPGRHRAVATGF
jgi:hypothetical protein